MYRDRRISLPDGVVKLVECLAGGRKMADNVMEHVREVIARFDGPGFQSRGDRDQAIEELRALETKVGETLALLMADLDPQTRQLAATAAIMIDADRGQTMILPLLLDDDPDVRYHTCGLLYDFGNSAAVPSLVQRLQTDREVSVRVFAADALGQISSRGVVIPLFAVAGLEETAEQDHEYSPLGFSPSGQARAALAEIRRGQTSEES